MQIYGKGKLETFRTYSFIDYRFPVDLLLRFELKLSKTLYGFLTLCWRLLQLNI